MNIWPETAQLLEEKINHFFDIGFGNDFFVFTKLKGTKAKTNKCDYIKGKHFSTVKKSPKKQKWKVKLWNGNKYLQTTYPEYGYYPIYTRNIYNSKKTQQINPTTKYGQRNCINKTYKWPVDTWKRPDSLQPQGL